MFFEKEGLKIEYKKCENKLPSSFWETYSAFANTEGGTIILGVDEKNGKFSVTGVQTPDRIVMDLFNQLNDRKKVSYNVVSDSDVIIEEIDNKSIVKVVVAEAFYENKPVYLKDNMRNTYIRLGEGDRQASSEELKAFVVNSHNDIDDELLEGYDIDDINTDTLERYRTILLNISEKNLKYKDLEYEDFLKEIGVYKRDRKNGGYKLTTGGLLFFGKYNSIRDRFKKFQLDYVRKKSSLDNKRWYDRISSGDVQYPELNVFDFYNLVLEKILLTINDEFYLDDSTKQRLSFKSNLEEAVREAFVNSLIHAYYDSDFSIKIEVYDDYYEFSNPGEMRISIPEFIHGGNSKMRNTVIPSLFKRIGIAEVLGSGGPVIYDTANQYSLKLPEIQSEYNKTTIRIWKISMSEEILKLDNIERLIMEYVLDNGSITKKEALETLKISEYNVKKYMKILVEKNYLEPVGKGRSRMYLLSNSSVDKTYQYKRMLKKLEENLNKI